MSEEPMRVARGRVIIVQEQFFRLRMDDGRTLLLTLGVGASNPPQDLYWLRDNGKPVEVVYQGEPGLESGKALELRLVRT